MNLEKRIDAFARLGLSLLSEAQKASHLMKKAEENNPWFTQKNIGLALEGIGFMLEGEKLSRWTSAYALSPSTPKVIGVAMAGNIPLVGFHDYLSILISGHHAQVKLSSQDKVLMTFLHELLVNIEPGFASQVSLVDFLKGYDAAIATGSDNTGRYFSYYFKHIPHIIRKNRSSCAVLIGGETEEELALLGHDVFSYFGLGCRNVSKLYIPEEYDLIPLLRNWEAFDWVMDHHKYANNHSYQSSIHLVNQKKYYDNGSILLIEDDRLVSPIAIVYYERYKDQNDLKQRLSRQSEKLQCIVSAKAWYQGSLAFGQAQKPEVWDYADGIDTLKFLSELN